MNFSILFLVLAVVLVIAVVILFNQLVNLRQMVRNGWADIEPTTKRYLLIKSREHFRAGFEPIAQHIVLLSGPGVTSSDYSLFRFNKIHRPIYPLDRDIQFHHLRSQ